MGSGFSLKYHPEVTPDNTKESAWDPNFGFENGRPERKMIATEAEMISAKLTAEERDFCAHKLIEYKQCRHDVWPWAYKCQPEKHAYMHCEYEDYIVRMKEYERERRLMERKVRKEKREKREALSA